MVSLLLNYFLLLGKNFFPIGENKAPIYTTLFSNITYVANIRAKIML